MLDKNTVAQIRKDVDAALAAVAAKHGITFNMGTIRFNSESMRGTLTATANNASTGLAEPLELKELKIKGIRILGIVENDLTLTYTSPTLGKVKFVGYHARKPKYPFIIEKVGSKKRFKISTTAAMSMMKTGV